MRCTRILTGSAGKRRNIEIDFFGGEPLMAMDTVRRTVEYARSLEEKHDNAPDGPDSATIGDGESIHSLAQRFGMKLAALRRLNPDVPDRPGSRLRLR